MGPVRLGEIAGAFARSRDQVPVESFSAGQSGMLVLENQSPGTIFRVTEVPHWIDSSAISQAPKAYRWFITGPRDKDGFNVSSINPSATEFPDPDPLLRFKDPEPIGRIGRCFGIQRQFGAEQVYQAMFAENAGILGRPIRIDIMRASGGEIGR